VTCPSIPSKLRRFAQVQIGHILLGSVLLASALIGGQDVEFALFDLQAGNSNAKAKVFF
jgi:hypothetical protein